MDAHWRRRDDDVPDDRCSEEVCVWLRLREGASLGPAEVREFCERKLAHFKIPRYVIVVGEVPMAVTAKVKSSSYGCADRQLAFAESAVWRTA